MSAVKDLFVRPIDGKTAKAIVKKYHYSGKVCMNSQVHFGVFNKNIIVGALQFGPSTDKRRMGISLGIGMNESLELNRMAISDVCGKNTESRVISICLRMLKKQYPFLKCIISFADACQCGDGAIYRASNFKLYSYKKNVSLLRLPNLEVVSDKTFNNNINKMYNGFSKADCSKLEGYQMKYIYYFDKEIEKKHQSISFDKIPDEVKMYKGIKRTEHDSNASDFQSEESGAIPTRSLQSIKSNDIHEELKNERA